MIYCHTPAFMISDHNNQHLTLTFPFYYLDNRGLGATVPIYFPVTNTKYLTTTVGVCHCMRAKTE